VPPAAAVPEPERWYGYQTLLVDAGALTLLVAGIAADDQSARTAIGVGAGAVYVVGGPLVHGLHGRGLAAVGSFGLRAGLPLLGGLVGALLGDLAPYDDGDEVVRGTVVGALGGIAAGVALDATLLGWERVPTPEGTAAAAGFGWQPRVTATATRTELGVTGWF